MSNIQHDWLRVSSRNNSMKMVTDNDDDDFIKSTDSDSGSESEGSMLGDNEEKCSGQ